MSLETRIPYDRNTGEIVIHDCSKVNMSLVKQITPTLIKNCLDIILVSMEIFFKNKKQMILEFNKSFIVCFSIGRY